MPDNYYIRQYQIDPSIGQLNGFSYVIKDLVSVKGYPVTFGLKPPFIRESEKDAAIIELLHKQGAKLLASTNLDPAAMSATGKNPFYGDMSNPVSDKILLGGSSGGVAAVVAKRAADFGIGSDHGGSVRIPAALCNVSGIKLSPGIIDTEGCILLGHEVDCLGLIASSEDSLLTIIENILPLPKLSVEDDSILIPCASDLAYCAPSVQESFHKITCKLKEHINILELNMGLKLDHISKIRKVIVSKLFDDIIRNYDYENLPLELQAIRKFADSITKFDFLEALTEAAAIKSSILSILGSKPLLTPLLPISVNELSSPSENLNIYLNLANIAGLPAINVRLNSKTDDIQLQLTGPVFCEKYLCLLAGKIKNLC